MGILDKHGNVTLSTRVPWFDYTVHPAKRFLYWSARHLRKLPEDWRPYYRHLLVNELKASTRLNTPWDVFIAVADGYRKGKWVLRKYGQDPDKDSIPYPYDDFWEVTTHEERVWAYRRSNQLKELQAMQREEQDLFGGTQPTYNYMTADMTYKLASGARQEQQGNQVHAHDLPAPRESDIREEEHMTHLLMGSIEDDRLWNPSLKQREYRESLAKSGADLMAFEDEMTDAEDDEDVRR